MAQRKKDPLPLSYLNVRKIIGVMGMLFPIIVFIGNAIFFDTSLLSSISANYHSNMYWFFIAVLWTIGFYMISYFFIEAEYRLEKILSILAGIAAFCVAIFPTDAKALDPTPHDPLYEWIGIPTLKSLADHTSLIHFTSAGILFIAIGIFLVAFFPGKEDPEDPESKIRTNVYRICGGVIFASVVVMGLDGLFLKQYIENNFLSNLVYWGEFVALFAFGFAWATRGEMLWKSAAPFKNRDRFNKLQDRHIKGYKDGMGWIAAAAALIFTMLLYSANTVPFNLFDEKKEDVTQQVASSNISTVLNETEEEPVSSIQVLNPDVLDDLCYKSEPEEDEKPEEVENPEDEESPEDFKPCIKIPGELPEEGFYLEREIKIANISEDKADIEVLITYSKPCESDSDCANFFSNENEIENLNSTTISGNSNQSLNLRFPTEEIEGKIHIIGGNSITTLPFEVMTYETYQETLSPTLVLGYSVENAKNILNGVLFVLTATVFFLILNFQVLPLFWPFIRRCFRVNLGEGDDARKENAELWALFSDIVNDLPANPNVSLNPNAETGVAAPEIMTKETQFLKAFFDLVNWIFPRIGYTLQMKKLHSTNRREGVYMAIRNAANKETIAEKIFWASDYQVKEVSQEDTANYRLLMIPAYYWFIQKIEEMDDFEPLEHAWEARAYYQLGHRIWNNQYDKSIEYHSQCIDRDPDFNPVHASLGRLWINKFQQTKDREYLKLAVTHLYTAHKSFQKESKLSFIYFSNYYNLLVALYYLEPEITEGQLSLEQSCRILKRELKFCLVLCSGSLSREISYTELRKFIRYFKENEKEYRNLLTPKKMTRFIDNFRKTYYQEKHIKKEKRSLKEISDVDILKLKDNKQFPDEYLPPEMIKIAKSNRLASWVIELIPTVEFLLLELEATDAIEKKEYGDSGTFYEWLNKRIEKSFNKIPYLENPTDLNNPCTEKAGHHFVMYSSTAQYAIACCFSMIAKIGKQYLPDTESDSINKLVNLALDHLEMTISKDKSYQEYSLDDNDLDFIRDEKPTRFYKIVGKKKPDGKGGPKKHDRIVYQLSDGRWVNKRITAKRPTSWHPTQKEAIAEARRNLIKDGGGELTIKGEDGKIRDKDTIGGGNDPRNIKG